MASSVRFDASQTKL